MASRALAYGQIVGPDDTRVDEVELSREPGNALTRMPAGWKTRPPHRGAAGQVLRAEYFRTRRWSAPGDTVRLVLNGAGFTVTASGRTPSSAIYRWRVGPGPDRLGRVVGRGTPRQAGRIAPLGRGPSKNVNSSAFPAILPLSSSG